jgi:hypothetical protein
VIAVGTAMIAAQLVTGFVMTLSRLLCSARCVSRIVGTPLRYNLVRAMSERVAP